MENSGLLPQPSSVTIHTPQRRALETLLLASSIRRLLTFEF